MYGMFVLFSALSVRRIGILHISVLRGETKSTRTPFNKPAHGTPTGHWVKGNRAYI